VPSVRVRVAGLPLGNVHAHCAIAYAFASLVEPAPDSPESVVPLMSESGAAIAAYRFRLSVHVAPPLQ